MHAQHPQFKFIRQSGDILEYQLSANVLQVLLKEDHSSPVVTVMVTYRVGSREETEDRRGSAHLLEHMMFKGTARYQKQKGTAIPAVLQRVGAQMNASTWTAQTAKSMKTCLKPGAAGSMRIPARPSTNHEPIERNEVWLCDSLPSHRSHIVVAPWSSMCPQLG